MDKKTTQQFKQLFLKLRAQERAKQKALELEESKMGDEAEKTLADQENQLMLKLKGRNRHYLKKIDQALERIDQGNFGECEECSQEIGTQRLFARPTASLCIHCKEEQEGLEGQICYSKKSHTHGKEILGAELYEIYRGPNKSSTSVSYTLPAV